MAGKKPGPAKGHGGRPRTKHPKPRADGYSRTTVGPKGKGKQEYVQRVKAFGGKIGGKKVAPRGSKRKGVVVDHKDGNRQNNTASNLRRTNKSQNAKNRHGHRYPR